MPLIITGNLNPKGELYQAYDDRIFSRIIDGTLLEIVGQDRRADGLKERVKSVTL